MIKIRYNNYHLHTHYSNVFSIDTVLKPKDLIKRIKELGHTALSSCEHGSAGNFLEKYQLAQDNGLKFIYGMEAYYVLNRLEKDNTNSHICIFATNKEGFNEINSLSSEANKTGYYYKPRWDLELLLSLNPKNTFITTACVASFINKNNNADIIKDFIEPLKNHFKDNFMLEIQDNKHIAQIEYNKILRLISEKFNIKKIHGCDTHYLLPEESKYRDLLLKGKGINYPEEDGFILDYPTYDEILKRYKIQGVFSEEEVIKALNNTLIFDEFEEIHFDKEIKMPSIYRDIDKNKKLKEIINENWKIEKEQIAKNKHNEYLEAIRQEYEIIEKTNMTDYFLLNEAIIKNAIERGGVLTKTGRGSAPSFFINKLLGFTEIDRLDSPITLYPTRFMSISRILESKSLADIDYNTADVKPFVEASKEKLGSDNVYLMIAYGTMKDKAAFRNYCRSLDLKVSDYNDISNNLEEYKEDPYWGKIIKESEIFLDVIDNIKPSPCSYLLLDKPISKEFGLIKIKDELCCFVDGYWSDNFKYLKNDFLTVSVWEIIADTFKLINKSIPNIRELTKLLNDKVWNLYKEGLTAGLNQVDTDSATMLVKKYCPQSIAELSSFIGAIRPGFASLLQIFLNREKFSYNIPEFDKLLESSSNFLLFQEDVMKTLIYAGFHEDETYSHIKLIAKKRPGIEKIKDQFLQGFTEKTNSKENAEKVWKIIEDNANYSFNSSHSLSVALDSLYGAYLKANFPLEFYIVLLNKYVDDIIKTEKIIHELPYFNINIYPIKFRKSQAKYSMEKETNSIYKGIESIKFLNEKIAEELYELRNNNYETFTDFLIHAKENTSVNTRQMQILIKLNFFDEFYKNKKLLQIHKKFEKRYKKTHKDKTKIVRIQEIKEFELNTPNESIDINEQIIEEKTNLGYTQTKVEIEYNINIVLDVNLKYTPKLNIYSLKEGMVKEYKIYKKTFKNMELEVGDIILITNEKLRPKMRKTEDGFEETGEKELYITDYSKVSIEKLNKYFKENNIIY